MMRRCFVCAADMLGPSDRHLAYRNGRVRAFPIACGACGLLLEPEADPAESRAHLAAQLAGPVFDSDPEAPYGLDLYTLRSAATGHGLGVRPCDAAGETALRRPHDRHAARGTLYALDGAAERPVSLGLFCRPAALEAALAALAVHAAWTDDVVILLDAAARPPAATAAAGFPQGTLRVGARPLGQEFGQESGQGSGHESGQDFAAQRNALQDLARHPWMLQLDADETLAAEAGRRLPALAALAETGDVVSIGLARRNHVDGVLSDVYPDVQYRLNRRSVRYAGRVHERPVLDGGWPRSLITLHGTIAHHLDRAHVLARSRHYERLAPGQGRPEEEAALLRPYGD
jgi:hypothetical protein